MDQRGGYGELRGQPIDDEAVLSGPMYCMKLRTGEDRQTMFVLSRAAYYLLGQLGTALGDRFFFNPRRMTA